jgi:hypothetical protein
MQIAIRLPFIGVYFSKIYSYVGGDRLPRTPNYRQGERKKLPEFNPMEFLMRLA